jgi:hypothetical protein
VSAGPKPRLGASSHLLSTALANLTIAGDFRDPVITAAGTRYFEPDDVLFFNELVCFARSSQPATVIPLRRRLRFLTDRRRRFIFAPGSWPDRFR